MLSCLLILTISICNCSYVTYNTINLRGEIPLSQFLTGISILYTPNRYDWISSIGEIDSSIWRDIHALKGDSAIKDIKGNRKRIRWRAMVIDKFSFTTIDEYDCNILSQYDENIASLSITQLKQIKKRFKHFSISSEKIDLLLLKKNIKNGTHSNDGEEILSKNGFHFLYPIKDKLMMDGSDKKVLEIIWKLFDGAFDNSTKSPITTSNGGKKEKSYTLKRKTPIPRDPRSLMRLLLSSSLEFLFILQNKPISSTKFEDKLLISSMILYSLLEDSNDL